MRLAIYLPSPIAWRLLAALLVAGAVVLSLLKTLHNPNYGDLDFGAYYRAASHVAAGQTPYQADDFGPMGSYPYAPAYACLLSPLAALDYLPAARLWLLLNWSAPGPDAGAGLAVGSRCDRPGRDHAAVGGAAAHDVFLGQLARRPGGHSHDPGLPGLGLGAANGLALAGRSGAGGRVRVEAGPRAVGAVVAGPATARTGRCRSGDGRADVTAGLLVRRGRFGAAPSGMAGACPRNPGAGADDSTGQPIAAGLAGATAVDQQRPRLFFGGQFAVLEPVVSVVACRCSGGHSVLRLAVRRLFRRLRLTRFKSVSRKRLYQKPCNSPCCSLP